MRNACALCILLASTMSSVRADWPMLARDAGRSGASPDEIRPPFSRKWYRTFEDEGIHTGVQPIVSDGKLFIGTLRGRLCAIDAETGADAWTFDAGAPILHAAASDGQRVYFGAGDGKLHAVEASTGKSSWTHQTPVALWNAPVVHGGLVLAGGRDGKLHACDSARGRLAWSAQTGGPLLNSPAIDGKSNRVYVGSEDMHVYAFDLRDGAQLWKSAKLPGVSFRGYHPVIAPDGSVMITATPLANGDILQQVLLDMAREVFGSFSSWRIKSEEEKKRIRAENFALMEKPETYAKQLDYLRRRLTEEPGSQTFFVLDPKTGRQRFVAPIVYAESMNGPCSPAIVTSDGKVIVKYSALLRSRYEHYSPFLNVGYLDTTTGHITPVMDQSRTYGWHDSLLLVHDEQSQLSAGGKVVFNTHQDNINGLDLETVRGYPQAMAHNVHEVKPGTAAAMWANHLGGKPLPMGWEWFARGTAVYGGGSVIDVPIVIDKVSFYFLPTHEINAGVVLLAYQMNPKGSASTRAPEPKEKLTDQQWQAVLRDRKWDWDTLASPRLNHVLQGGLPDVVQGTTARPMTEEAEKRVGAVTDAELEALIWSEPRIKGGRPSSNLHQELARAVAELVDGEWRPLLFPAGKHPGEAYRLFTDPSETLYTLSLAYPHLEPELRERIRERARAVRSLKNHPERGEVRSLYDEFPSLTPRVLRDLHRSETARIYPLWLWATVADDWEPLKAEWNAIRNAIDEKPAKDEFDLGNGRISGLIAACRIAKRFDDQAALEGLIPKTRNAIRERLKYELAHSERGLMTRPPGQRTIFGRWRNLTPDIAAILRKYARDTHRHLMDVYVDHHRPGWFVAWGPELMWRNETPFSFPTLATEIFSARAWVLAEEPSKLAAFVDLPWCKADEYYIQKLALCLIQLD